MTGQKRTVYDARTECRLTREAGAFRPARLAKALPKFTRRVRRSVAMVLEHKFRARGGVCEGGDGAEATNQSSWRSETCHSTNPCIVLPLLAQG
jgi:hypothetical protein